MSRPPNIIRPSTVNLGIPEDVKARLMLYLYSPAERRVPNGAYSRFMVDRISEFFARQVLIPPPGEIARLLAELKSSFDMIASLADHGGPEALQTIASWAKGSALKIPLSKEPSNV